MLAMLPLPEEEAAEAAGGSEAPQADQQQQQQEASDADAGQQLEGALWPVGQVRVCVRQRGKQPSLYMRPSIPAPFLWPHGCMQKRRKLPLRDGAWQVP